MREMEHGRKSSLDPCASTELTFVDDLDPQFAGFVELGAGLGTGDDEIAEQAGQSALGLLKDE